MKNIFLLASLLSMITMWSCEKKTMDEHTTIDSSAAQYTCPMHPEVISNTPGKCPKCGMELVKKEAKPMEMKPDSIMKGDSTMKM